MNDTQYTALQTEINTDPLTRGYGGMSDEALAIDINTEYRTSNRTSMTGDEVFGATDNTEFTGLSDHLRELWVSFTSKDSINPANATNIALLDYIFGGSSTTKTTLATLRQIQISRASELELPTVTAGDVRYARSL